MMRKAALLLAFMTAAVSVTGCSSKDSKSGVSVNTSSTAAEPASGSSSAPLLSGPLLKLSSANVRPGETAEITLSVAKTGGWNMCGLHIVYPDALEVPIASEGKYIKYKDGDVLWNAQGRVAQHCTKDMAEKLGGPGSDAIFFTTYFDGDSGEDGDIATFYFNVPADAAPGTVYPLEFKFHSSDAVSDMFIQTGNDPAYMDYAISNWQGGTITVE